MSKKVLMVATVAATIGSFNMDNIRILRELGYQVDIAADFDDLSVWSKERLEFFRKQLDDMGIEAIQLDFSRSPLKLNCHIASYKKAVKLLEEKQYEFIHTHTPIASAVMRIAAHKTGTKVIYTAHGFHFYEGAPIKNWLIFYPVEKYLSRYTDILLTINQEDYMRAKNRFYAKKIKYIPGVGVDTEKYGRDYHGEEIRSELGITESQIMLLSVGELNDNKNHVSVIKALPKLPAHLVYVVVGKGDLMEYLQSEIVNCGLEDRVKLVGYRTDVADFYDAADAYILPSIREGLNVSLMEAMASGLPCAAGKIRGNTDLIDEGKGGVLFQADSVDEIEESINRLLSSDLISMGNYNEQKISSFDIKVVEKAMNEVYREIGGGLA